MREYISSNWIETNQAIVEGKHKQVYYFSMEFLMGRLLLITKYYEFRHPTNY